MSKQYRNNRRKLNVLMHNLQNKLDTIKGLITLYIPLLGAAIVPVAINEGIPLVQSKFIEKEIEDNDYLLDSYGIIDEKSSKLSRSNKKVFSEIDFTFIPVTNDEISNDLVQKAIQKNQKIGLIVTPTDCTYASIYKTIDKVKQLVQDYNIECPILYDITKYMSDQYIRANCLLAEEFCNKLSANGCYIALAGSSDNLQEFAEKFQEFTETHSTDLYDKMVFLEEKESLDDLYSIPNCNMAMLDTGIVLWKHNLSDVIKKESLNDEHKFIGEYSYTIKHGDYLEQIANNYNMKVEDLAAYNEIDPNKIYPEEEIIIPNNYSNLEENIINSIIEEDKEKTNTKKYLGDIETERLTSLLKGIDVSEYQGDIDWDLVKEDVDFAILRLCDFYHRTSTDDCLLDKKFLYNILACEEKNIPVGIYYFSRATTKEEAINEAEFVAEKLKEYSLEYPVYMDVETEYLNNLIVNSKEEFKIIAQAAMETLEANGYFSGIYCNRNVFKNIEDLSNKYTFWLTSNKTYNQQVDFTSFKEENFPILYTPNNNVAIYQYSECGKVAGINGNVDIDYATNILEKVIEENGYSKVKK